MAAPIIGRLTMSPVSADRQDYIACGTWDSLRGFGGDWEGYAGMLCMTPAGRDETISLPSVFGPPGLEYLTDGDVVRLTPSGRVNVLYRRASAHNTILTTERCNSFCLMCSQPPKPEEDAWRVDTILRLLDLVDPATNEIGLTGGEPTLLGDGLLAIIDKAATRLPNTAIHLLTNGRRFVDPELANRLGRIGHPDLMLGIPLYSDIDSLHDYVVQAQGAYSETIQGFYNLAAAGVRLELRVVLHKQTFQRLPRLAEFIGRNLPFVEHVALMGLEMFGFTPRNLDVLWIDPVDYWPALEEATLLLSRQGMNVSIYNHQLCTIPESLWPFARKSISDWKNVYLDACESCGVRDFCGGFFQSATKRHSESIRPLPCPPEPALSFLRRLHRLDSGTGNAVSSSGELIAGGS